MLGIYSRFSCEKERKSISEYKQIMRVYETLAKHFDANFNFQHHDFENVNIYPSTKLITTSLVLLMFYGSSVSCS